MIQKVELDFPFKQKKPFSAARQLILPGAMSSCTDAVSIFFGNLIEIPSRTGAG